jgi:membrane protease YdiL (CAAX protease family)
MAADPLLSEKTTARGAPPSRCVQAVELGVFLFLILPSMVLSFSTTRQGRVGFVPVAIMTIFRDLSLMSLILFFVWRNQETVARIGWLFKKRWPDVLLGLVLFAPILLGTALLDGALQSIGFSAPATPRPTFLDVRGLGEGVLALVLVAVVALAEETIFRGYLLLRCKALTANTPAAVLLSSIIFSIGHGYEGTSGVVTVGTMGAILAVIYLWRRSLVAPIVIHFLQDFLGVIILPLLTAR